MPRLLFGTHVAYCGEFEVVGQTSLDLGIESYLFVAGEMCGRGSPRLDAYVDKGILLESCHD